MSNVIRFQTVIQPEHFTNPIIVDVRMFTKDLQVISVIRTTDRQDISSELGDNERNHFVGVALDRQLAEAIAQRRERLPEHLRARLQSVERRRAPLLIELDARGAKHALGEALLPRVAIDMPLA